MTCTPTRSPTFAVAGPVRAGVGPCALSRGGGRVRARGGAVVIVQRFGSALNLNVHLHTLVLDGVFAGVPVLDPFADVAPILAGLAAASVRGVAALGPRAGRPMRRCGDDRFVRRRARLGTRKKRTAQAAVDMMRVARGCALDLHCAGARDGEISLTEIGAGKDK